MCTVKQSVKSVKRSDTSRKVSKTYGKRSFGKRYLLWIRQNEWRASGRQYYNYYWYAVWVYDPFHGEGMTAESRLHTDTGQANAGGSISSEIECHQIQRQPAPAGAPTDCHFLGSLVMSTRLFPRLFKERAVFCLCHVLHCNVMDAACMAFCFVIFFGPLISLTYTIVLHLHDSLLHLYGSLLFIHCLLFIFLVMCMADLHWCFLSILIFVLQYLFCHQSQKHCWTCLILPLGKPDWLNWSCDE